MACLLLLELSPEGWPQHSGIWLKTSGSSALGSIWVPLFLDSEASSDKSAADHRSLVNSEEQVGSSLAMSF